MDDGEPPGPYTECDVIEGLLPVLEGGLDDRFHEWLIYCPFAGSWYDDSSFVTSPWLTMFVGGLDLERL